MNNYFIWECAYTNDKLVQVFNNYDLPNVQAHFIKQGYFIKETFIGTGGDYFFVIRRLEND